jgi:hypothetical protein
MIFFTLWRQPAGAVGVVRETQSRANPKHSVVPQFYTNEISCANYGGCRYHINGTRENIIHDRVNMNARRLKK